MKASRQWILWAHGPLAECAAADLRYPASLALVELAESPGRGRVTVPHALLRELLDVAETYGPGSATDDMGPWWKGERNRVIRECRAALTATPQSA